MSVLIEYCKIKLKPCPFCGMNNQYMTKESTNVYENDERCDRYVVHCHICGASIGALSTTMDDGVKLAQAMWRTRE